MGALQKIVKVTQQQYNTLKNGGTVGGYTGLNSNYIYLVQEDGVDTDTWRKVQLDGTDKLGTGTNTNPLNIKAGNNMNITESNGTFTFAATDTTYTPGTGLSLSNGAFSVKTGYSTNGKNYKVTTDTNGNLYVNVPWTDTHVSHDHSVGVGLVGSGNAGTSGGTYTYKAKLRSETALTEDSAAATTTSGRVYPVAVDKSGYLSVNVPWKNTNTASAVDNILDGSHSGTKITYAPYAAQQSKLSFDTSTSAPTRTDRLNLNGYLYVTKFNVAGKAAVQYNSTEDCIEFIFA